MIYLIIVVVYIAFSLPVIYELYKNKKTTINKTLDRFILESELKKLIKFKKADILTEAQMKAKTNLGENMR
jgi:hypothetical protein